MMNSIIKAAGKVYLASIATGIIGAGIEGAEHLAKKGQQRRNTEKQDLAKYADQSVNWWQQFIQDGLDAIAVNDSKAPERRMTVTTAQAREVKATVTNWMLNNEDPRATYVGTAIKGLSFEMQVGNRNFTVHHQISIRNINGTIVPFVEVYSNADAHASHKTGEKTPMYRKYIHLWEALYNQVNDAEEFLSHGTPVGKPVKYVKTNCVAR